MSDLISRQAAIEALNGIINRFEQILRDIRESKVDDSVCGMCEYDGAFVGQSGDWCNECPGFEKDDCFRLSDECRKRWLESVELPAAQPEKRTNKRTETHACDLISRQAAIDAFGLSEKTRKYGGDHSGYDTRMLYEIQDILEGLPSAQLEWNNHTVACLLAELFDDTCACNYNGIDEWLPLKCDFAETCCPHPVGVACWEQYLKHRSERKGNG